MDKELGYGKRNFKLAFDLIELEYDKNGNEIEGKGKRIEMTTLDEYGIDYSSDIKRVHVKGISDLYNDLIYLMQDKDLQIKVAKALIDKGLITKDNADKLEFDLMVWEMKDNQFCEYGCSFCNIDLVELVNRG